MTIVPWDHVRWSWLLPVMFLLLLTPVRVGDLLYALNDTGQVATVPLVVGVGAVVAIFICTGAALTGHGDRRAIVVALIVLTFGPNLVLGAAWIEMAGLLGGVLLVTVPSPWSWSAYLVVIVVDAIVHGMLNGSLSVALSDLSTNGNIGIVTLAVTRLAQLLDQAVRTRTDLAAAHARKELAHAHAEVRVAVGARLSAIIRATTNTSTDSRSRTSELNGIAESARAAVRAAQAAPAMATDTPVQREAGRPLPGVPFRFAMAMTLAIMIFYEINAISDIGMMPSRLNRPDLVAYLLSTVAACGLHMYHGVARADGAEPRWWRWTCAFQWCLAVPLPLLLFPPLVVISIALTLAISITVIRLPDPWSFGFLGLTSGVVIPIMVRLILGPEPTLGAAVSQYVYLAFSMTIGPLALYALYQLPIVTQRLLATSDELARVVAATERMRFARNLHDLLGFHLSAITLTAELADRSRATDPDRAEQLIADVRSHAEAALAQLRTIDAESQLRLDEEIAAARSLLEAASIRVVAHRLELPPIATQTDHVLGVVIREAATNVVRHSTARRCTIELHRDRDRFRLHVSNDGAAVDTTAPGQGLHNLRARMVEAGGAFTVRRHGDSFTLVAEVPA